MKTAKKIALFLIFVFALMDSATAGQYTIQAGADKSLDLMDLFLLYLLISVSGGALVVLCAIHFPQRISRIRNHSEQFGIRSLLLGFINVIFWFLSIIFIGKIGEIFSPINLFLLIPFGMLCVGGIAAFASEAQRIGFSITNLHEAKTISSARSMLLGAMTIELVSLFPIIGQIFLLCILLRGFGAFTATLFSRRKS
ncbi:MAG: hypothetical protein ACE1ZS_05485 [Candidatus Poribacteria bacterium]